MSLIQSQQHKCTSVPANILNDCFGFSSGMTTILRIYNCIPKFLSYLAAPPKSMTLYSSQMATDVSHLSSCPLHPASDMPGSYSLCLVHKRHHSRSRLAHAEHSSTCQIHLDVCWWRKNELESFLQGRKMCIIWQVDWWHSLSSGKALR